MDQVRLINKAAGMCDIRPTQAVFPCESILVHVAGIPSVHPAVDDCLLGLLGTVPITHHDHMAKNRRSGRKMSDAIFIAKNASGRLAIGDKKEIDKATWSKPRGIRLTPTSRYIRDKLFPKRR